MEIKIVAFDNISEAVKDFLQKVINPPLEEAGLFLKDNIRSWRVNNQINILIKAEENLKPKNIGTRKISLKQLVPLLEDSSLEEDKTLQEKWAALIANIVREDSKINTTIFGYILSQLTKEDAEVFEAIFEHCTITTKFGSTSRTERIDRAFYTGSFQSDEETFISADNLIRLRLIREEGNSSSFVTLTQLGLEFMNACTA